MSASLSLSLELVLLMDWLLKHEKKTIQKLIKKVLKKGLEEEIDLVDTFYQEKLLDMDSDISQELHNSILDFLISLEDMLIDGLEEKKAFEEKGFSQSLQKINKQKLDNKTVLLSLKKTNDVIKKTAKNKSEQRHDKIKNTLFSELLKNWSPTTNEPVN
jgi:hypothetical protein